MDELKIGFIHATNEIDVHWFKPLVYSYLKAYLDVNLKSQVGMCFLEAPEGLHDFNIIAISSTSQDYGRAIKIAKQARFENKDAIIILGGNHITFLPETLTKDFDLAVLGEGENTFFELVMYFQKNGLKLNAEKLRTINGIAFWDNGYLTKTNRRELITPLDTIPHPERQAGAQYIFTSRGCPYKCSFCNSSAFWEKTRKFSAEYVVDEIEQILMKFPDIKHISVQDDLFIADMPRFRKICDLIDQKGMNKKVSFAFSARANLINDELCETIKRLNIHAAVYFGAESASDRILRILRKNTTAAQNQKALDTLHKHGIPGSCSFIVGVPSETEEEVCSTYEFIIRNMSEGKISLPPAVNILMPLPGTEFWDLLYKEGLIDIDRFDWNRLSIFASYRHSKICDNIEKWVEYRRANRSIYLNEKTLPQERLFEIMVNYEKKIKELENRYNIINMNKLWIFQDKHYELDELLIGDIDINNNNSAHSLIANQINEDSFVLDVGCSYGYMGEWLIKNKNCTIYGIDIDEIALHKVKTEGFYKDAFEIDLDYPEKNLSELKRFHELNVEFDYIICGDILEHLKDPTGTLVMLSDRLKEDGKILISIPNIAHVDIILNLIEGNFNYSETGILDNSHLRFFTKNSFLDWVRSINNHILKEYSLDVALVGATKSESELVRYVKNNYTGTYSLLINAIGEDFNVLQYIFVLTKKKQQAKGNINDGSFKSDLKRIKLIDKHLEELRNLEKKLIEKDKILQKLFSNTYRITPINLKTRPSIIKDRISVIIPVKNGGEQLSGLLSKIRSQRKVSHVEIIVIDSGSIDNSVQIAKEFDAKVIEIPQKEFNHGATRNLGAKEASGDFLVFIVQDAMPINDYWLYNMICPFIEYPELAALSSKQFVKPEADLFSLWMNETILPYDRDVIYSFSKDSKEINLWLFDSVTKRRLTFFDNVSSCIRRDTFKEIQFSPLINAEDMDFGVKLLEKRKTIGYLASTGVYHWHERGADYVFKRHYIGTKNACILKNELPYFFDRNNINWECLSANLSGIYDLISISIAELGDIDHEPVKAIKSFINALQKNIDASPDWIEKALKERRIQGNDGLDLLLKEVIGDTVFTLEEQYDFNQNFLIPGFMKHLKNFAAHLCSKHHTLEGREKDFILCLYKIFAIVAGEGLGAYYLEAETLNRLTPDLKRIDYFLGKGVCYF